MSFSVTNVGDTAPLRSTTARRAVVRPFPGVADRGCVRPGCLSPARSTLTFQYARREAVLASLTIEQTPDGYDLCATHASRTRPPHGWRLTDHRSQEEREQQAQQDAGPSTPTAPRADLGGQSTVAVLAAALRAVPEDAPEAGEPAVPEPVREQVPVDDGTDLDAAAATDTSDGVGYVQDVLDPGIVEDAGAPDGRRDVRAREVDARSEAPRAPARDW